MATAQQNQKQNGQQAADQQSDKNILEQSIEMTNAEKFPLVERAIDARVPKIEELLPDFLKGQGKRLAERALLTFKGKADLHSCTPASFVKCVLDAAELGFAVDGRLCHAVPYNNTRKVEEHGREVTKTFREVQLQVDYKGLIAVAKRNKLIQDCWARIIYEDDDFTFYEENAKTIYRLEPSLAPRKGVRQLGVLSVATHAEGWYRVDFMFTEEIDVIRNRSKSYTSSRGPSGPWLNDENEMRKKTGVRRLLKTFTDDPGLARLFEIDNQDFEDGFEPDKPESIVQQGTKLQQLTKRIRKPSPTHYVGPDPPQSQNQQQDESNQGEPGGTESVDQSQQESSESEGNQSEPDTDPKFPNEAAMTRYIEEIKKASTKESKQYAYDGFFVVNVDQIPWTTDEQTLGAKIKTEQILAFQSSSKAKTGSKGQLFDQSTTPSAQEQGV